jgi:hypothetical protein
MDSGDWEQTCKAPFFREQKIVPCQCVYLVCIQEAGLELDDDWPFEGGWTDWRWKKGVEPRPRNTVYNPIGKAATATANQPRRDM